MVSQLPRFLSMNSTNPMAFLICEYLRLGHCRWKPVSTSDDNIYHRDSHQSISWSRVPNVTIMNFLERSGSVLARRTLEPHSEQNCRSSATPLVVLVSLKTFSFSCPSTTRTCCADTSPCPFHQHQYMSYVDNGTHLPQKKAI